MCPPDCPRCAGYVCDACAEVGGDLAIKGPCEHDAVERHKGVPSLELAQSRVPTKPIPPMSKTDTIEITLADADDLAQFFERLAHKLRAQGKVRITIE